MSTSSAASSSSSPSSSNSVIYSSSSSFSSSSSSSSVLQEKQCSLHFTLPSLLHHWVCCVETFVRRSTMEDNSTVRTRIGCLQGRLGLQRRRSIRSRGCCRWKGRCGGRLWREKRGGKRGAALMEREASVLVNEYLVSTVKGDAGRVQSEDFSDVYGSHLKAALPARADGLMTTRAEPASKGKAIRGMLVSRNGMQKRYGERGATKILEQWQTKTEHQRRQITG
ncbi:uncharacterized protein MONOS_8999 [Monocercomonoides exilis]|uniref:uncharacterized protein n=1 Tax=Monocercomonoides exilis TaxID=2049356 RepID=UPI00355A3ECF|nr:hypothetical protein MONOS_8999 [Monocercomonoides exilis]|eukprot:MONOS_8999.1-p1 / transcript=MONOS_8999.1 / gene=MONOS_8999 / organism=Monocercomonoides_exilis_PA203 / gene_product=unspecified product / transcript_product=unspecified product / location=Mono_scaffold00356:30778-32129(-) / protein_length=224 / sequence_SO=supercontig / SO=protein_coding / is_pseudo=false